MFTLQKNVGSLLHRVDGTCVEWLEKRKHRRDNTSGFRGVYRTGQNRYRVQIGFKGRRFYVGRYDSFEEAIQARMEAETLIHEGFVRAYREWQKCCEKDPDWEKTHPFIFDVEKRNGVLKVITTRETED